MTQINAEWIPYKDVYRLYDPQHPQNTLTYAEDEDEAMDIAADEGCQLVICDADTMFVPLMDEVG